MTSDPSGCLSGLGELAVALAQRRDHQAVRALGTEEQHFADSHWRLTAADAGRWVLTNTATVPAADVRLTLRSDSRPGTRRRRAAIVLCDMFGRDATAERLRATLPATTRDLTTVTTHPVAPKQALPISAPAERWDWVEVDWSSTDEQTHWTKLKPPW